MGTGTCWRCGASEDGALSSYGDPRDAEIARLKAAQDGIHAVGYREGVLAERQHSLKATADGNAEIARLRAALAAGPAALRSLRSDDYSPGYVADVVERAQAEAMKEGT